MSNNKPILKTRAFLIRFQVNDDSEIESPKIGALSDDNDGCDLMCQANDSRIGKR
jgi:hypothetical protein